MTEPIRNRARNRFQNQCGTRSGTTDQNQSQIQTVVSAGFVVVGTSLALHADVAYGLASCNAEREIR